MMQGRELQKNNDLFFTCSLIAYIARRTKNKPVDVVDALGEANLAKYMSWQMFIIVTILTELVMILLRSVIFSRGISTMWQSVNILCPLIGILARCTRG